METEERKSCGLRAYRRKMMLTSDYQIRNLEGSGQTLVMCQAMYAIIGAVALERGGLRANEVVQERILHPLGLKQQEY